MSHLGEFTHAHLIDLRTNPSIRYY